MKDNIERLFKESLENYAMPYNGAAWDALSKKLDAAAPAAPFYKKWWFAASLAGAAALATGLLFGTKENSHNPVRNTTANTVAFEQPAMQDQPNSGTAANTSANSAQTGETGQNQSAQLSAATEKPHATDNTSRPEPVPSDMRYAIRLPGLPADAPKQPSGNSSPEAFALSLPKTVCLNQDLEIVNPNKEELVLVTHPNGRQTGIKAGAKSVIRANTPGTFRIASGKHNYSVDVLTPDMAGSIVQVSDSPFENGIPEVRLEANGFDGPVTWTSSVPSSVAKGNMLTIHPFRQLEIDVTATAKDAAGCAITEKQVIRLDKRYNLLAENAFNPASSIPRNREFMPEALKIRDVAFRLTVVDPKNGGVVYETSDASQGWDGTDIRNGESVRPGSVWAWKVVIVNPLPGEPSMYSGTVQATNN